MVVQADAQLAVAAATSAVSTIRVGAAAGRGSGVVAIGQKTPVSVGSMDDGGDAPDAGRAMPKTGELFERTFHTSKGPVDLLAETVVVGDTLILKDIVVFGRSESRLTGLAKEALAARTQLIEEAKALGFKELKIIGQRVASCSSANPGHTIDITVDLTR